LALQVNTVKQHGPLFEENQPVGASPDLGVARRELNSLASTPIHHAELSGFT
jgi:hypothetical protein